MWWRMMRGEKVVARMERELHPGGPHADGADNMRVHTDDDQRHRPDRGKQCTDGLIAAKPIDDRGLHDWFREGSIRPVAVIASVAEEQFWVETHRRIVEDEAFH